eukprot:TRINITY_DN33819_c0_g1_i1.p1 TRINITY_DN33819_c0_g1~~TRINITY_DN33819_c0_g1_i1.p1  ORF type:complete len:488 (+),score=102.35 TRINITY_DN33819_c0_g1_i1:76-1539(+)
MGCRSSKSEIAPHAPYVEPEEPVQEAKPANEDIRDKYEIGEIIGSGSFGQVRKAFLKEDKNEVRAVKVINNGAAGEEGGENKTFFEIEVQMLQEVSHEHIIRFFDFYEDPHFLYAVMEFCCGGELFDKIVELKRFSEKMAAMLGKQMLLAIEYIHNLKIVHRDVKAENFMLSGPLITSQIKMIDFGMSTKLEPGEQLTELCGSPHYLAPELIGQQYNNAVDIWAFGVLVYLLMYGHYPYDSKHPRDIMIKIVSEPTRWQTKAKLTPLCLDFIKNALDRSAITRSTASECLQHAWIVHGSVQGNPPGVPRIDTVEISPEVIRSAYKKVTSTRKQVDPQIDELRSKKLRELDASWRQGVSQGQRLGSTTRQNNMEHMGKPEFLRRESRLSSAPSRQQQAVDQLASEMREGGQASSRTASQAQGSQPRSRQRPKTLTEAKFHDMYQMSKHEEQNLMRLYREKSLQMQQNNGSMGGIVPVQGGCLPGSVTK